MTVEEVERKKMKPTCIVSPLTTALDTIGFTGLDNLGNTCFMSSVIQILANTTLFRDYFLSSEFQGELNRTNPLGSGGRLAVEFALVVRILWDGSKDSFAPARLKRLVAEKATHFRGFAQHDAQEFLAFLLDGLHEDLNRIVDKPYVPDVSLDDFPEQEAAEETWRRYKSRNDSFIVDKLQGQYRSKLTCPECDKVSVTFDPYMYLSVPIPKKKVEVSLFYFPKNGHSAPRKISLWVPKGCGMNHIGEELSTAIGVRPQKFRYMEVEDQRPRLLASDLRTYAISRYTSLYVFEVELPSVAGEKVVNLCCTQRTLNPSVQCARCQVPGSTQHLSRCTRCRLVFYCNSECQKAAWPTHKRSCKKGDGMVRVGEPFMVSLLTSQLTYQRLATAMESFARYSVNLFKPPRQAPSSSGDITADPTETKQSADTSFYIKGVNALGNASVNGKATQYLADKGEETLDVRSEYLTLDWQYSKIKLHISSKELEHEVVETGQASGSTNRSEHVSLGQCLELFTKQETLSEDEAWFCPRCKTNREATKQMYLWSLPEILIIQLKRFSFRNAIYRDKIGEFVDYPIQGLDVSDFFVGPPTSQAHIYDLYGVVNHHGVMLGGHYTAYARCLDLCDSTKTVTDWRLMDDSRVTSVRGETGVMNQAAYVLFYQRRAPAVIGPTAPLPSKVNLQKTSADVEDEDKSTPDAALYGFSESEPGLKGLDQSKVPSNELIGYESSQSKSIFDDLNQSESTWNGLNRYNDTEKKYNGPNKNRLQVRESDDALEGINPSRLTLNEQNQLRGLQKESGVSNHSGLSETLAEFSKELITDNYLGYTDMDTLDE